MPRLTIQQRIAYLDEQKKRLQARLNRQDRVRDTRRKVLLGALVLQRLEQGKLQVGQLDAWLRKELPGFLTRDIDRALFVDLTGVIQEPAAAPSRNGAISNDMSSHGNGSGNRSADSHA